MLIDRPERLAAAAAAPKGTRLPANEVAVALDRRLSRETEGDVLFDPASRGRYATDASIYQIMPVGVLVPKSDRDVADRARDRPRARRAGAAARRRHEPVRPDDRRGAGHRHHQAPAQRRRRRRRAPRRDGRAGPGSRPPQRAAEAARPLVPGRRLDQRAGDDRRHGRQQLVRLALDRLRQHGPQRARHRHAARRRRRRLVRADEGRERPRRRDRRLRARPRAQEPRRDRGALAEGAAPRRRLQPRHLPSAEREALHRRRQRQPRAPAGRRRGHARLDADADAQARAAAEREGARRRQFPDLPRGDGRRRSTSSRSARPRSSWSTGR